MPVQRLYEAFVDESLRSRWLPDDQMSERTSTRPRSARFDWGDGQTRVHVTFNAKGDGEGGSIAAVQHIRLADAEQAERMKAFWRNHLATRESRLAGGDVDA